MAGQDVGTLFLPPAKPIRGRRRWIGSAAHVEGKLLLDEGAVRAVADKGSSLLAIGVRQVQGDSAAELWYRFAISRAKKWLAA